MACICHCLVLNESLYLTSLQFSLVTQLSLTATPWTAACQASLSLTNSQSLLKFTSME